MKYSYCEVYVKRILPAIRILIAKELLEKYGYTQLGISKLLGVSQPFLNYYISGRRRPKYIVVLERDPLIRDIVKKEVDCLVKRKCTNITPCDLCTELRMKGIESILNLLGINPKDIIYPECIFQG
ncbi:transcriptional regulator-like protein [Staphylothermus marinus F1]|uniref:Transcriptional regulator-like protein n=1 Tax=Staphylothermus marinus (strain ATCC 43588 / DSM 3639 / JCM 9404 / F1) TaxID=399550 RepID=A3DMC6_STAMF|nr:helix-turn-helix domain-containing protein [Staphylothermus marinus]ABN69786.1 transcriptional regulator-like protein [Staphylothermus marinus F1]